MKAGYSEQKKYGSRDKYDGPHHSFHTLVSIWKFRKIEDIQQRRT